MNLPQEWGAVLQDFSEALGEPLRLCLREYDVLEPPAKVILLKGRRSKYIGLVAERNPLAEKIRPVCEKPLNGKSAIFLYSFGFEVYQFLRNVFPQLRPKTFDHRPSFGCGDRLGMVSAAHVRALERFPVFPVLAQQSPRELERTRRTFREVLVDAAWGVLESGYQGPFGADADHIKDEERLLEAMDAGFTIYTLDLSGEVNHRILREGASSLQGFSSNVREILRWHARGRYVLSQDVRLELSEEKLPPVVLSYLPAIEKVERFSDLLRGRLGSSFSLEISLDEGEGITSPEAHFFVAEELRRRGVNFESLAPRFPGSFEKGVDYIGDIEKFARALRVHAVIQRNLGGYRLSLHSGSDKFSIYPVFFQETGGFFHLKTSGTSWLRALETLAEARPELFFQVYRIAYDTFEENAKAYHVSVRKEELPVTPENITKQDLRMLFVDPRIRQLLHIAYGSVLDALGEELREVLAQEEERHYGKVEENIRKHLLALFGESFKEV
ncbi:MAG: hypothetical protein H5U36_08965 [Candidatus Caldatribacterium sp.]|nr:hypothetical protein [Candidatus Caldatribacterium sp.]